MGAELYEVKADNLTKEDRISLNKELMENQNEKRDLHIQMESIKKNVEFINRLQAELMAVMEKEGKMLNRAMKCYLDQAEDGHKEQNRIMKRLGMKKIKHVKSDAVTFTT